MSRLRRWRDALSRTAFATVLVVAIAAAPTPTAAVQERAQATTIFLVRHAERADDDPQDPGLTEAGIERADELARILGDAGLTAVYSTPFRRTMATAKPVAEKAGVEIDTYDPRDPTAMQAFVERLRTGSGRVLVSGHSNTTPALVQALGGDPVSAMPETEYDRLYVVTIGPDGTVSSVMLRYGRPSVN
jgi:broad specificity phosphatase PhoE